MRLQESAKIVAEDLQGVLSSDRHELSADLGGDTAPSEESLQGETEAAIVTVYPELRRIARGMLKRERTYHTLQPTALANEALRRILEREAAGEDPRLLVAYGIREMRTILMDSGRRYQVRLRHVGVTRTQRAPSHNRLEQVVELQRCLERLGELDPRAKQVVELRYLLGLSLKETAQYLGVSERTVGIDWEFARCWLAREWRRCQD